MARAKRTTGAGAISAEPTVAAETVVEPVAAEPAGTRGRQGDQARPACPYCSTDAKPVLCEARRSDPFFTRYYCPAAGCAFSVKVPRPGGRRVEQDALAAR